MAKLSCFNFITLNGFYKGINNDLGWHTHNQEGSEFSEQNLKAGNMLLFGRTTFEMMAGFWPTEMAAENSPAVAEAMNTAEKIVFSKTLQHASWNNTTIVKDDIVAAVKSLKQSSAKNMTILGSGSILSLFAEHGLIDEFQFMIDPVAIGSGTPVFSNISQQLNLELIDTHTFKNGSILLTYRLKQ